VVVLWKRNSSRLAVSSGMIYVPEVVSLWRGISRIRLTGVLPAIQ
jgi:hypothetical protein